jgi:7,8-dihydropterin-6-yl-methyl-4-(beta-D-ribofuranosyl)aminobenzene 5'-phosphate synthase
MSVKITVIYDNKNANPLLQEGWGLSLFIEHEKKKILFDVGGDKKAFLANLEKLQVPMTEITDVVISHNHWDHIAGLEHVLSKVSAHTNVYLPKFFPGWFLSRKFRSLNFVPYSHFHHLDQNFYCFSMEVVSKQVSESPNSRFMNLLQGRFQLHEQILAVSVDQGLVLFTGCAHPGILNILHEAKQLFPEKNLKAVLGGFHLYKSDPECTKDIVHAFQGYAVEKVAACHCSGEYIQKQFQEVYEGNFLSIGTGSIIHF